MESGQKRGRDNADTCTETTQVSKRLKAAMNSSSRIDTGGTWPAEQALTGPYVDRCRTRTLSDGDALEMGALAVRLPQAPPVGEEEAKLPSTLQRMDVATNSSTAEQDGEAHEESAEATLKAIRVSLSPSAQRLMRWVARPTPALAVAAPASPALAIIPYHPSVTPGWLSDPCSTLGQSPKLGPTMAFGSTCQVGHSTGSGASSCGMDVDEE